MALKIHIHAGSRVLTVDVASAVTQAQYLDLMERLMAALSRHGVTHDDAQPGHPFYGNQYTDVVLGPKPTEAKTKGVKNQVHELLSSGHPFDFDELKTMTGAKLNQQLHNAINELKAGKHTAGKLHIEKIGGKYQVVKADGTPAPGIAPGAAKAADPSPSPTQAEKTAPSPVPEAPSAPPAEVSPEQSAVPKAPGSWSKADADAHYTDKLHKESMAIAQSYLAGHATLEEAAHAWKTEKAIAMAQWAHHVNGSPMTPKAVEVFLADKVLVQDLTALVGLPPDQQKQGLVDATYKWKEATAKAKAEAAQKAAQKVEPPKPTAPVNLLLAATPTGGHTIPAPEKIVPDDHGHISADDFHSSKYSKGIADLHKKLHGSASESASANKKHIQEALGKRLKASPHFQAMEAQYAKTNSATFGGSLSARLISAWASSSGDHQPISVSAQLAIRDAFKMNPEHVETKAFHYLDSHSEDQTHKDAAAALNIDVSTPEKLASYKEGMKDFALAQYHETQDHLAKLGVKELYLIRGMKIGSSSAGAQHVKVKLQPASSFSTAHSTAKDFAGAGSLFAVKVPASQVIGSFCSGYGCTDESEVVVLNHPEMHAFQVGASTASDKTGLESAVAKAYPNTSAKSVSTSPGSTKNIKGPGAFKPSTLPVPAGTSKNWTAKLKAAATSGDLQALDDVIQSIYKSPANLPNTQKYAEQLKAHVKMQHTEWLQKVQEHQKMTQGVSMATPNKTPPLKNAYYYKKLKEKILSHPLHSESTYKGLKDIGHTNEKVLGYYEQMHEKTYGKKYHA